MCVVGGTSLYGGRGTIIGTVDRGHPAALDPQRDHRHRRARARLQHVRRAHHPRRGRPPGARRASADRGAADDGDHGTRRRRRPPVAPLVDDDRRSRSTSAPVTALAGVDFSVGSGRGRRTARGQRGGQVDPHQDPRPGPCARAPARSASRVSRPIPEHPRRDRRGHRDDLPGLRPRRADVDRPEPLPRPGADAVVSGPLRSMDRPYIRTKTARAHEPRRDHQGHRPRHPDRHAFRRRAPGDRDRPGDVLRGRTSSSWTSRRTTSGSRRPTGSCGSSARPRRPATRASSSATTSTTCSRSWTGSWCCGTA